MPRPGWQDIIIRRDADMKIPIIDRALSVLSFLNGTGTIRGGFALQSISGTDIDTLRRVNVR